MGKASKFGKAVGILFGLFIIIGLIGIIAEDEDFGLSCPSGYYPVGNGNCCPVGTFSDGTGCIEDTTGEYQSGGFQTGGFQSGGSQGTISGGNCGGYGTLFVTQPISIYRQAVVEVDGYTVGVTNMEIPVAAGSHHVRAWGMTVSGNQQSMSWNTYVDSCKQSLIKWN